MKHSLEYYSLHYLNIWLEHDRLYHESINNGTRDKKLTGIKEAAAYYKVARNLPKSYDKGERYESILNILDEVNADDFSRNTLQSIEEVQNKISACYGDRSVLSFTTKLLWLKIRSPIIIYDSQARKALNTPNGNLLEFYKAWRDEYNTHSKSIANVCAGLNCVAKYSCDKSISQSYIQDISAQPWFQERVFDVYLWHKGQ